jgi:hypothetical protein
MEAVALPVRAVTTSEIDVISEPRPKNNFRDHASQRTTGRLIDFRDDEEDHLSYRRTPSSRAARRSVATHERTESPRQTAFPQLSIIQDRLIAAITRISAGPEFLGEDRMPKTRMPVAERRQESGDSVTGSSAGNLGITGRIPGLVPGPERVLTWAGGPVKTTRR